MFWKECKYARTLPAGLLLSASPYTNEPQSKNLTGDFYRAFKATYAAKTNENWNWEEGKEEDLTRPSLPRVVLCVRARAMAISPSLSPPPSPPNLYRDVRFWVVSF